MPRETINSMPRIDSPLPNELQISWNRIGWVQAHVFKSGDDQGLHIDLNANEVDRLLKVLRKAKRQAYGNGYSHPGFEPYGSVTYSSEPVGERVEVLPAIITTV